jgi:hypothetical protein
MTNAFLTITVSKKGKIRQVRQGEKAVRPKKGAAGKKALGEGAAVVGKLELELLVHERKKKGGKGKGKGKGGTDPCCFRDPRTGNVWCWC